MNGMEKIDRDRCVLAFTPKTKWYKKPPCI